MYRNTATKGRIIPSKVQDNVQVMPAASGESLDKLKVELEDKSKVLRHLDEILLDDLSPRQAFDVVWKMLKEQK